MAGARKDYYANVLASDRYMASRAAKAALVARICGSFLAGARTVVDLGCGTGLIKAELARRFNRTVIGIDISREFLRSADDVIVGDLLALPFRDGAFDFAICNHVYEHVADLKTFFHELRRIIAPGGTVYMAAGSKYALMEPHYRLPFLSWLPRGAADRYLRATGRGAAYEGIRLAGRRTILRRAAEAGFSVVDVTRAVIVENAAAIAWAPARAAVVALKLMPALISEALLALASPQWFFLLSPRGAHHEWKTHENR